MRELVVTLRFMQPCLGSVKMPNGDFMFPRDHDPDVILFHDRWWASMLHFAALAAGRHLELVRGIVWEPKIICPTSQGRSVRWYNRHGKDDRVIRHEHFAVGECISVACLTPSELSIKDLEMLFTLAGQYRGMSPFQPGQFGRFRLESIVPRTRIDVQDDPA